MSDQFGIIQTPQAFLYQKAGAPDGSNSSSIEDEVLSGWFVKLLSSDNEGWYYVETHYGYRAFLSASAVSLCDEAAVKERSANAQIRRVAVPEADVLSQPKVQGSLLETLPCCAVPEVLAAADLPNGWCLVRTASGCEGYMQEAHLTFRTDSDAGLLRAEDDEQFFAAAAATVLASLDADGEAALRRKITDSARSYLGTQYRWGGKSHRGIDCSGLVFMSYLENGLLLFRDAAIKDGYPVHEIPREALQEGDLLFFPGHVAMYLGNDLYIHATGFAADARVTINSLNMHDPLYRPDLVSILTACGTIFKKEEQTEDAPQEETASDAASLTPALSSCFEEIRPMLDAFTGNVSVLYKDLTTGAAFRYRTDYRHPSASVIKLYLMAAMFRGFEDGEFSPEDRIPVPAADFVPSCGVLTYLDADKSVSLRDLIELMIIVSDNTACNILVDFYGEERLQSYINQTLGLHATSFQRKMFDSARAARGMDNFTSTDETAGLLEQIWNGTLVSEDASRQMLQMLEHQRLNGKIPFHLHAVRPKPVIAHKTGENDGVSHDVAIFEGDHPFLLLFMGSETDVPAWERMIGDLSLQIYEAHRQGC